MKPPNLVVSFFLIIFEYQNNRSIMKVYIVTQYFPSTNTTIIESVYTSLDDAEQQKTFLQNIDRDGAIIGIQPRNLNDCF